MDYKKVLDGLTRKKEKKDNLIKEIDEINDKLNEKLEINFNDIDDLLEKEEKELTEKLNDVKKKRRLIEQRKILIDKLEYIKEDIKESLDEINNYFNN
jgi:chromosome segregation ATPase